MRGLLYFNSTFFIDGKEGSTSQNCCYLYVSCRVHKVRLFFPLLPGEPYCPVPPSVKRVIFLCVFFLNVLVCFLFIEWKVYEIDIILRFGSQYQKIGALSASIGDPYH